MIIRIFKDPKKYKFSKIDLKVEWLIIDGSLKKFKKKNKINR